MTIETHKAVFLGVDGGGSNSRFLFLDANGLEVFSAFAGAANLTSQGSESVAELFKHQLQLFDAQGHGEMVIAGAVLGLAGLLYKKDYSGFISQLQEIVLKRQTIKPVIELVTDSHLVWFAAAKGKPAIALISGTGSVAYGIDQDGARLVRGGLGALLSDEGSGFQIGLAGLQHAIRAHEGRDEATTLSGALYAHFEIEDISSTLEKASSREQIASFAKVVLTQAQAGDSISIQIVMQAARYLAGLVESMLIEGNFDRASLLVGIYGSCLQRSQLLRDELAARLAEIEPQLRVVSPALSAERAAAEIALTKRENLPLARLANYPAGDISYEVYVPDGAGPTSALARTTHMAIAAHPDDIEIIAHHGIASCYGHAQQWFSGVVICDGGGSPAIGPYARIERSKMIDIRRQEQLEASRLGEYSCLVQLGIDSGLIKANLDEALVSRLCDLLNASKPHSAYLHNIADSHQTHVSCSLHALEAIKQMVPEDRPRNIYGVEVWRGLDWLPAKFRLELDTSDMPDLRSALIQVFDSQIAAGKRYDRAIEARATANATFADSHAVDQHSSLVFAMNLKPLVDNPQLTARDYWREVLAAFDQLVDANLAHLEPKS